MTAFLTRHDKLPLLLFILWGLLLYSNSVNVPFYFDDLNNIENNSPIQINSLSVKNLYDAAIKSHIPTRPVSNITLAINYYFNQLYVQEYHFINIAIHILNGFLLYTLITSILTSTALKGLYRQPNLIALCCALLWFSHPVNTQSVTYIIQRMNSLSAMFFLLAFILYIKARHSLSKSNQLLFFVGSVFVWLLALGSKENAVMLPFFIFLYEWYFINGLDPSWLKRHVPYVLGILSLFVIIALVYIGANPIEHILAGYKGRDFTLLERLLTQPRVILHYISLLLYPHPDRLTLDYDFQLSHSLTAPPSPLLSIFFLISLFLVAIHTAKKHRLVSFSLLWFLGNLFIESSFIPLEIIYEHRTYVPYMLLPLIPLHLFNRYLHYKYVGAIIGCIILIFGYWTIERNSVWGDPESFWMDNVAKSQCKPRPYNELGLVLLKKNQAEKAAAHFRKSLEIDPDFGDGHINAGIVHATKGELDKAVIHFSKAVRLKPGREIGHRSLGKALFTLGRIDESIPPLSKAAAFNPKTRETHEYLGKAYMLIDKPDHAVSHFAEILELEPDNAIAQKHLSEALALTKNE